MKKVIFSILALISASLLVCSVAFAADVTTTMPVGTWKATITEVDAKTDVWGAEVTELDFDPLTEIVVGGVKMGVFAPDHYYAIDIGVSGGGRPADYDFSGIALTWTEVSTPEADEPFGNRIGATYKLMTWTTAGDEEDPLNTDEKKLINEAAPPELSVEASYTTGHWVRVYVGIITDPSEYGYTEPADIVKHMFGYSTPTGDYAGMLTISFS